jgi:superfamily II DNA/RNA helicase
VGCCRKVSYDSATAARTIAELEAEIVSLRGLEQQALRVRRSGTDRKWMELLALLQDNPEMRDPVRGQHKLVIFSEHRDTLHYLVERLRTLVGRPDAIVYIHGGMHRDERRVVEDQFRNNPDTLILVATDAAGEGINLQRAHLMVNYDLPWNPNRLEQRFGRIHRIGQTEVCHLWNLVAGQTREGAVYQQLLRKLEQNGMRSTAGVRRARKVIPGHAAAENANEAIHMATIRVRAWLEQAVEVPRL